MNELVITRSAFLTLCVLILFQSYTFLLEGDLIIHLLLWRGKLLCWCVYLLTTFPSCCILDSSRSILCLILYISYYISLYTDLLLSIVVIISVDVCVNDGCFFM